MALPSNPPSSLHRHKPWQQRRRRPRFSPSNRRSSSLLQVMFRRHSTPTLRRRVSPLPTAHLRLPSTLLSASSRRRSSVSSNRLAPQERPQPTVLTAPHPVAPEKRSAATIRASVA